MYNYREVLCGYCTHKFMWEKDSIFHYNRKDGKAGLGVKCPKCGECLVVFDGELTAEPVEF